MIVTRSNFQSVLSALRKRERLSLDTETTGLRMYQQDRIFSLIIGTEVDTYYFNFQDYENIEEDYVLPRTLFGELQAGVFSDPSKLWYLHNAKFDMGGLHREGAELAGPVHCTEAVARVLYNEHLTYSLDACAKRIGLTKDDAVEEYISEHGLWEWDQIPGKKTRSKNKFFHLVPFNIVSAYGETDARITYQLGRNQEEALHSHLLSTPQGQPQLSQVVENEKRFTKTCFEMERVGVKIDSVYCQKAALFEGSRAEKVALEFEKVTGLPFKDSNKVLAEAFTKLGEKFPLTEKGNPSFASEVLSEFESPVAQLVLDFRDARSKANYYHGFLYFADSDGRVHPNMRQGGTATGRTSGSDPNFQNLTKEDSEADLAKEFLVRRAIVPTPGFFFACPDYDQVEYRLMLEHAARKEGQITPLIEAVLSGLDVHEACAQLAQAMGFQITRSQAKTVNFLTLYGGGNAKLAKGLGCSLDAAKSIQDSIFKAAPEIRRLIRGIIRTAESRGYVFNWFGRRSYFSDHNFAYKAPNYLIQGGAADVMKIAQNRILDRLRGHKSRMLVQVHDELLFEIHESEAAILPDLKGIMEQVFPHRYLPLTVGMDHAFKSWADKVAGFPA